MVAHATLEGFENFADSVEGGTAAVVDGDVGRGEVGFEGGHGDLGEDDGVDFGGEFFDFIEEHVVVFFGMAGLEHLEGFGAESGFDFDGSAGFVGGDLE